MNKSKLFFTYRKKTLYSSLAWQSELNFEDCYVSSCTFGGPVAVWQKSVQSPSKQIILIYSCSGIRISSIVVSYFLFKGFKRRIY